MTHLILLLSVLSQNPHFYPPPEQAPATKMPVPMAPPEN